MIVSKHIQTWRYNHISKHLINQTEDSTTTTEDYAVTWPATEIVAKFP